MCEANITLDWQVIYYRHANTHTHSQGIWYVPKSGAGDGGHMNTHTHTHTRTHTHTHIYRHTHTHTHTYIHTHTHTHALSLSFSGTHMLCLTHIQTQGKYDVCQSLGQEMVAKESRFLEELCSNDIIDSTDVRNISKFKVSR